MPADFLVLELVRDVRSGDERVDVVEHHEAKDWELELP